MFYLYFLTPALIPLVWFNRLMVRVWKGDERLLRLLLTPPIAARKGYEVAKAAAMFTLSWWGTFFIGGVVALNWSDQVKPSLHATLTPTLTVLGNVLLAMSVLAFLLTASVYLFLWPTFLVPRPLRDGTGAWRVWRDKRREGPEHPRHERS